MYERFLRTLDECDPLDGKLVLDVGCGSGQYAAALADGGALSEEFVLADLQDARSALEEITGRRGAEDVLAHIFERFCIGK